MIHLVVKWIYLAIIEHPFCDKAYPHRGKNDSLVGKEELLSYKDHSFKGKDDPFRGKAYLHSVQVDPLKGQLSLLKASYCRYLGAVI